MQWDNTFLGKARNTDDGQISSIHNVQDGSRPFVCNSCIFRTPVQPGGDVYLPACFPPESLQDNAKPAPLVLSDEDMGEVSLQNSALQSSRILTLFSSYILFLCTQIPCFLSTN